MSSTGAAASTAAVTRRPAAAAARAPRKRDLERAAIWLLSLAVTAGLAVFFLWPLVTILARSLLTPEGIGLANVQGVLVSRRFGNLLRNTAVMAVLSTSLTVVLAFLYAYALQRTRAPMRSLLRVVALIPLFAPSMVQGQGLLLLLGRNGLLNRSLGLGFDIYGFPGLLVANLLYAFPYAFLILSAALAVADQRLYEGAETLGAGPWRMFRDVTLPGARYGVAAAIFVTFTLVITDFGNPMVIGGDYSVLATEVYNQVIGQAQFERGAVIGLVLLLPAILAKWIERRVLPRQPDALVSAQARPLFVKRAPVRDGVFGLLAAAVAACIAAVVLIVVAASFVTLWPYNLTVTVKHYRFDVQNGLEPLWNSILVSIAAAVAGVVATTLASVVVLKFRTLLAGPISYVAILPSAVPGMVLGLGYVLTFNDAGSPLHGLYGTLTLIVVLTVYYNHAHGFLLASTSLRQISSSFDEAATTLGAGAVRALRTVTLPLLLPTMLGIGVFYFMRSMVSLSAVIFLITPATQVASVSVLQLTDRGAYNQAAAFSTCIMAVVLAALLSTQALLRVAGIRNVALIR